MNACVDGYSAVLNSLKLGCAVTKGVSPAIARIGILSEFILPIVRADLDAHFHYRIPTDSDTRYDLGLDA